ncbi:hypothetical protein [Nitratireductor sp. ZSWI3]|nr:hypothetical protein [Nitratireductor sp. ZSWI3]MCR4269512.1 hypothetical protein [Nitratireductor sp. ZSWI3]
MDIGSVEGSAAKRRLSGRCSKAHIEIDRIGPEDCGKIVLGLAA